MKKHPALTTERLIALAIFGIIIFWVAIHSIFSKKQVDATKPEKALPAVIVQDSTAQDKPRMLALFGETAPNKMIDIQARTGGYIEELLIIEGQKVSEGDILMRIAPETRTLQLKSLEADLKATELQYNSTKKLLQDNLRSQQDFASLEAQLENKRLNVERLKKDIEYTQIAAPFSGVVGAPQVKQGSVVAAGTIVTSLAQLNPVEIEVHVPEKQIAHVTTNAIALVEIGEKQYSGTITSIAKIANPNTRTFALRVSLNNDDEAILAGQTAKVALMLASEKAHLVSPAYLVLSDDGRYGFKVVDADDIVRFQTAVLIADTEEGSWVGGFNDQERFIVMGGPYVKEGQKVRAFYSQDEALKAAQQENNEAK